MSFFQRGIIHHFKINFPVPIDKIQHCLKRLQFLNFSKTSAVCISLNGHSESAQSCQLLHQSIMTARIHNKVPIYTFLEGKATSLTYYTASAAQSIIANKFCLLGDVALADKSYRNIKKLLDIIGIKCEQIGMKNEASKLWSQFIQKSNQQKRITEKWLKTVENTMTNSISKIRKIPKQQVELVKNKLLHPKDALKYKLIDSISTFQQFTNLNFPNHYVENIIYRTDGKRVNEFLTDYQKNSFINLMQILEMPKVILFSSQDPLLGYIQQVLNMIELRMSTKQGMDILQNFLEISFNMENWNKKQILMF